MISNMRKVTFLVFAIFFNFLSMMTVQAGEDSLPEERKDAIVERMKAKLEQIKSEENVGFPVSITNDSELTFLVYVTKKLETMSFGPLGTIEAKNRWDKMTGQLIMAKLFLGYKLEPGQPLDINVRKDEEIVFYRESASGFAANASCVVEAGKHCAIAVFSNAKEKIRSKFSPQTAEQGLLTSAKNSVFRKENPAVKHYAAAEEALGHFEQFSARISVSSSGKQFRIIDQGNYSFAIECLTQRGEWLPCLN